LLTSSKVYLRIVLSENSHALEFLSTASKMILADNSWKNSKILNRRVSHFSPHYQDFIKPADLRKELDYSDEHLQRLLWSLD